jgi:hypothetical protein
MSRQTIEFHPFEETLRGSSNRHLQIRAAFTELQQPVLFCLGPLKQCNHDSKAVEFPNRRDDHGSANNGTEDDRITS